MFSRSALASRRVSIASKGGTERPVSVLDLVARQKSLELLSCDSVLLGRSHEEIFSLDVRPIV